MGSHFGGAHHASRAYDKALETLALESAVLQEVSNGIVNDTLGDKPMAQAMVFWNQAKLEKLVAQTIANLTKESNDLAEMLLYDILRQYTKDHVRMNIEDYATGDLTKVSSSDVSVNGLNAAQRELIYKHFSTVPWKIQPGGKPADQRMPVKDWRDLITYWGAEPVFVGPDGPD